ncbi:MAG: methyltransferase domain-containing protein [Gallionella sp.]|nr:methyltransferase domain-containing protein [Gallionella sp.]MDD4947307.1 methyltransferase domain-containing protein [Gallionella sp.]MDD5612789.1 methyltransferase domain-containing protein [Gallionella sp.]
MRFYRKFLGGVPEYLARYYWWAYLWRWGIWLFDHQPIINAILFGQYDKLLHNTLAQAKKRPGARLLQLTCVYGKLTPVLLAASDNDVHLCDVATGQLLLARRKTLEVASRCPLARMNAERLAYADDTFDQVIVFFLLHEMPPEARRRTYGEIARVVRAGGSVLLTEYAPLPVRHPLYRFVPFRWLLGRLEPFLPGFWREDVAAELRQALANNGKSLDGEPHVEYCFDGFYRVMRFTINRPD